MLHNDALIKVAANYLVDRSDRGHETDLKLHGNDPIEVIDTTRNELHKRGLSHAMTESVLQSLCHFVASEGLKYTNKKHPAQMYVRVVVTDKKPGDLPEFKSFHMIAVNGEHKSDLGSSSVTMKYTIDGTVSSASDEIDAFMFTELQKEKNLLIFFGDMVGIGTNGADIDQTMEATTPGIDGAGGMGSAEEVEIPETLQGVDKQSADIMVVLEDIETAKQAIEAGDTDISAIDISALVKKAADMIDTAVKDGTASPALASTVIAEIGDLGQTISASDMKATDISATIQTIETSFETLTADTGTAAPQIAGTIATAVESATAQVHLSPADSITVATEVISAIQDVIANPPDGVEPATLDNLSSALKVGDTSAVLQVIADAPQVISNMPTDIQVDLGSAVVATEVTFADLSSASTEVAAKIESGEISIDSRTPPAETIVDTVTADGAKANTGAQVVTANAGDAGINAITTDGIAADAPSVEKAVVAKIKEAVEAGDKVGLANIVTTTPNIVENMPESVAGPVKQVQSVIQTQDGGTAENIMSNNGIKQDAPANTQIKPEVIEQAVAAKADVVKTVEAIKEAAQAKTDPVQKQTLEKIATQEESAVEAVLQEAQGFDTDSKQGVVKVEAAEIKDPVDPCSGCGGDCSKCFRNASHGMTVADMVAQSVSEMGFAEDMTANSNTATTEIAAATGIGDTSTSGSVTIEAAEIRDPVDPCSGCGGDCSKCFKNTAQGMTVADMVAQSVSEMGFDDQSSDNDNVRYDMPKVG